MEMPCPPLLATHPSHSTPCATKHGVTHPKDIELLLKATATNLIITQLMELGY